MVSPGPDPNLVRLAIAVADLRPEPERILQIECGDGDVVIFLAREFRAARVRGVDHSRAAIRAAQARVGLDPEGRVAFKAADPRQLPFPEDLFDLVVQLSGLPATAEIVRVLRPGGHLVLVQRSSPGWVGRMLESLRLWRLTRRGLMPVRTERSTAGNFLVARLKGDR